MHKKIYGHCFLCLLQDKHCSREALLAGLKLEEQQAQSPNQSSSQYITTFSIHLDTLLLHETTLYACLCLNYFLSC